MAHDIRACANIRQTSIEIAEAIFDIADNDEALAQKMWAEGCDEALEIAFTKTDQNKLCWGEESVERKNV